MFPRLDGRAVDIVMDGRPSREGRRLSLLPENFDTLSRADQDVALDEGISGLMEAEVIRTRKGGGARELPAGIISRNMAAIARLAGPQAAGRFGSFVEAFRGFFGLATDRAHRIRRGLADGSLDRADYDAYFGKLGARTWPRSRDVHPATYHSVARSGSSTAMAATAGSMRMASARRVRARSVRPVTAA
ncbi:MAG: hypothetical protein KF712_04630 [Akkermansiaceae bacterium]|nr:hypothetical protein [Akkermansiaceae bacterium]